MLRNAIIIFFLPVLFSLGSCGGSSKAPTWTLLIYMAADDGDASLKAAAQSNIQAMESATSSNNVRVIVQIGDDESTKRYRISDGGREELANLGHLDMSNEDTLKSFLRWGSTAFPAEHTALILWGHGDGWDQDLRTPAQFAPRAMFTNGDRSIVLSNHRIRRAIESAKVKLDVLGFDGCNMGTLEALYEFHKLASVLITSEEEIPLNGWNYHGLLSSLSQGRTNNAHQFGLIAVESYTHFYALSSFNTTLSAFSSKKITAIAKAVDHLAITLIDKLEQHSATTVTAIKDARANTLPVVQGGYTYIDLIDFFRRLSLGVDLDITPLEDSLTTARYIHSTSPSLTSNDQPLIHGASIVFYNLTDEFGRNVYNPHYRPYDAHQQTGNPAAFLEEYNWSQFLDEYYQASGQLP